ncbi:MAG TPA: hypothetical protein GX513_06120, partial [Firmicutes bacterium]|nr:hypothetical protein [Bacillota bacterium]
MVSLLMVGVLASTYPGSTRVTYAQEGGSYPPQVAEGFTFIHLTDPHMGSGAGNKFTPQIVTEIASLPDKPSFVVVGGDLTELGSQEQYAAYDATLAPLGVPIYSTLGNHESRWLDAGKGNFINRYGRRSYDFAYQGIHFVVLDTSVSNQTHGHFELSTLTWLRERLATWGKDAPVVVFMHHPVGYPGQRFIDNEQDFLDAVEGYHVVAVFTGHGHVNASWRRNGIPFLMTKAAMEGGYAIVRVGEGKLSVYTKTVGEEPVLAKTLLLAKGPHEPAPSPVPKGTSDAAISVPITSLSIVRPGPGTAVRQDFPLQVRVTPEDSRLEYRVDGGSWVPMAETATVPVAQMVPGFHVITVRATSGDDVWTKEVQILLDLATSRLAPLPAPVLAWRCPTGGGVQAQPVVDETRGVVYFGSNDGAL